MDWRRTRCTCAMRVPSLAGGVRRCGMGLPSLASRPPEVPVQPFALLLAGLPELFQAELVGHAWLAGSGAVAPEGEHAARHFVFGHGEAIGLGLSALLRLHTPSQGVAIHRCVGKIGGAL